ncbi:MAG: hypothetical protein JOZ62_23310 [Acidobacteriaceae bacterium]|nr:hypothetical protein [Acidobacteriaceae bacterium]
MSDKEKSSDQRDATLAAEQRPIPSQAEGERETVEEDLAQKGNAQSGTPSDKK